MPSQLTVTGTAGAGLTVTAKVYSNVTSFTFNDTTKVLTLVQDTVSIDVAITAATTVTFTITGGNYVVTIS